MKIKTSSYEKRGEDAALKVMIGTWQTHYNSWKRMNKNFLLIKV